MWPVSAATPHVAIPLWVRVVAVTLLALPAVLLVAFAYAMFSRDQVDKDSQHPERTRVLVTSGVFTHTRNPMYLSLVLVLCAVAVGLASPTALLVALVFFLFVRRFQVVPEERALREKFGSAYEDYSARVRRWV
jgi:protein-S-isoprenylcysteine O-methyltransferase Ste14